jgi:hypothetical protein
MEFSSDLQLKRIPELVREFFDHVLFDEKPLFVGDEATMLDVSLASPDELAKRCSEYYRTSVSADDLKQPLWKLIRELNERRGRPQDGERP